MTVRGLAMAAMMLAGLLAGCTGRDAVAQGGTFAHMVREGGFAEPKDKDA